MFYAFQVHNLRTSTHVDLVVLLHIICALSNFMDILIYFRLLNYVCNLCGAFLDVAFGCM
jgi:nucleoside permease NupC